ncbi:MAG TPA: hypothetical protein VIL46_12485 [Gemmataceae bacterium]
MIAQFTGENEAGIGVLLTLLPGPSRKRTYSLYRYRITYRNPHPAEPGCVMTWAVEGGREAYQIALERDEAGRLRWHCTCADAVYRSEQIPGHLCKHVRGLIDCSPPAPPAARRLSA